ncbi:hypothetical protein MVEN_00602600 [Mycena venus]|uniref:Uncharacterized protein n=1 Tax=Mycena venus TaxID=2733690 RepID=A0A8H7D5V2_9AGAR|nr:hypothetical protein MVEN_00602600 [Mycena venus]
MDDSWYIISQLWVGTFFYGIYLVLFCICIYILLSRPHNLGNTILLVTAIALFALSTVQAIINLVLGAADIDDIDIPYDQLVDATTVIYAVNNFIADGLVIYRCYVIYNNNVYVVILPIMMLIVGTVFGVDLDLGAGLLFILSLATNVLLTVLTAGRIWWICRRSRVYLKTEEQRRCVSAMAILVESGVIYSATVLAFLVLGAFPSSEIVREPIFQMLNQVMGIAPTLIIVRVGLGVSVKNVKMTVKTAEAMSDNMHSQKRPILGARVGQPDLNKDVPAIPNDVDVEKGRPE